MYDCLYILYIYIKWSFKDICLVRHIQCFKLLEIRLDLTKLEPSVVIVENAITEISI